MLFCVISLLLFACWAQAQDLRRHRKQRFVVPNHEGESLVETKLDNERSLLRQEVASYWTRLLQGPATQVTSLSVTFSVDPFSIDPFSIDPFSFAFTDTPTAAPTEGLIILDIDDDFEVSCSGKMSSGVASCGGGKMSGPGTSKGKSKGGSKGGTSKGTGSETSKGKGGKMSSTSAPATAPVDVVSLGEDDDDDDVASPVGKGGKMSSSGKMSGGKMSRGLMERLR